MTNLELKAIVDALRKTEDGEPIYPGRTLYYPSFKVVGSYVAGGGGCQTDVFSTRAAAKASMQGG